MPEPRRKYTRRQKAAAVVAASVDTVAGASEATGIPESTIRYWRDSPRFAELRAKTREDEAAGFKVLLHMAQARLAELIPEMEARDLVILAGVATDKGQLLSGQATSRTESKSLTEGLDDHEKELLRDVIDKAAEEANAVGD